MTTALPSTYSRMLVRELGLDDAGIRQLLAGTALEKKDLFTLDSDISWQDQYTIIRQGLALSGNPALGLQIGSHMPLSAHGAVGVALASAPNTEEALQVLARFGILRVPMIQARTHTHARQLTLTLDSSMPMDAVGRFMMEVMVASMRVLADIPQEQQPRQITVDLAYPAPDYAERYHDYLHAGLRFGQPHTAVHFQLSDLRQPNPFADAEVYRQALELCERLHIQKSHQESWRTRVVGLLQQHPGHIWRIQDVASALHVSVRSLTRHLGQEQCSYQRLLDDELCRQALLHLSIPGQTVASVANILGYQDVSSFRRAFRRWRGIPPQDWREQDGADRAKLA